MVTALQQADLSAMVDMPITRIDNPDAKNFDNAIKHTL